VIVRSLGNGFIAALRKILWPRRRPLRAERICIYRVGAIGDLVCATPAMFAIRRAYPLAHLTLLTTPGKYHGARHAEELLGAAGWIDEIITYDLGEIGSIAERLELGAKLRAHKFDLWFDLTLDRAKFSRMLRDMMLARLLGARWAYGWPLDHLGFAARAEAEVKEFPDEVERLARILRICGIGEDATIFPPLADHPKDATLHPLLSDPNFAGRPLVAIAPGARRPCNLWPLDRFAAVSAYLAARGIAVVLIGSADDRVICEQIRSRCDNFPINLAGKLTLLESCALLRRCDLLVCVDSAPQHLAAAVGGRCVALFSQRNPRRRWYPHGNQHRVLEGAVECHSCLLDECPYDNRCMKQITVEQVLAAVEGVLQLDADRRVDGEFAEPPMTSA
jgi:ADP-heptose:LPS heptosyltransferase